MYAGWAAPAHCHATCTTVTHYILLSRIDSYWEAVWNPILGTFRSDYEYEIEYEYDFSILVFRLHIITTHTHFIP